MCIRDSLDADMRALLKKRVYDIAAITDKAVKVKFNSQVVPVKNFQQYVDLYIGSKADTKRIYEEANERWEYAVCLTPNDEFTQVSFVNGIHTSKGGKHVEYILNQITRKLVAYIKQKRKVDVKPNTLKEQLMLLKGLYTYNILDKVYGQWHLLVANPKQKKESLTITFLYPRLLIQHLDIL